MTEESHKIQIVKKIVVVFDICSSTHIVEDLIKSDQVVIWRNILINLKEYLTQECRKIQGNKYKFVGDGWILLFQENCELVYIINMLSNIYQHFKKYYNENILNFLETPPTTEGLTFGIDNGNLIQIEMDNNIEYIGRPINIAARLQSIIQTSDIKQGYRVFMPYRLLDDKYFSKYNPLRITRSLKNVNAGNQFICRAISLPGTQLKIIEAKYGIGSDYIDVTNQYSTNIIDGLLNATVTNEIAGRDPAKGKGKKLFIKYQLDGEIKDHECLEGDTIVLP